MFEVVVICGGVIGGMILRQLTKYQLSCALLEKNSDVSGGQSRANSGIVHSGLDAKEGTLKARFNVLGNKLMPAVCEELGVNYVNNGSLIVAFNEEEAQILQELKARGEKNGVVGLRIIDKEELNKIEKNISANAICALHAPTGGIVCPYGLTIAAIGNAMDNGASLYTDFEVCAIDKNSEGFTITSTQGASVKAKAVINCAGFNCDKIASLIGDTSFKMGARRGEYILLAKNDFVNNTLFFTPTKKGKGILISQTVDGNVILGPTAEECEGNITTTSASGLESVISKAKEMCNNIPLFDTITSFAGVRAYCDRHDFIIEKSAVDNRFINVAGIESPGLTSAPAIAEYVVNELIGSLMELKSNESFNGKREVAFRELPITQKNEIIKNDPSFGKLVCKCEIVTEGEVVKAIKQNPPARTIDGIKLRTRSGMGRCQGGFCQSRIAEILARELNLSFEEVTKKGKGSEIVVGVSK